MSNAIQGTMDAQDRAAKIQAREDEVLMAKKTADIAKEIIGLVRDLSYKAGLMQIERDDLRDLLQKLAMSLSAVLDVHKCCRSDENLELIEKSEAMLRKSEVECPCCLYRFPCADDDIEVTCPECLEMFFVEKETSDAEK